MIIVTQVNREKFVRLKKLYSPKLSSKDPYGHRNLRNPIVSFSQKKNSQTQINDEVSPYLPKVEEVLADLSKEKLIQRLVSVEFARFPQLLQKCQRPQ